MANDLRSRMNKKTKNISQADMKSIMDGNPSETKMIGDALKKYKGKSEGELMAELQKAAAKGRASGDLTDEKLDKIAKQVMPMIDSSQQQKMKQLLGMLKK